MLDLEDEGERIFSKARDIEAKDIEKACFLMQRSSEKYDEIQSLIDSKRNLIIKAKFKYKKMTLLNLLTGFAAGVIASMVAAGLLELLHKIHISLPK